MLYVESGSAFRSPASSPSCTPRLSEGDRAGSSNHAETPEPPMHQRPLTRAGQGRMLALGGGTGLFTVLHGCWWL